MRRRYSALRLGRAVQEIRVALDLTQLELGLEAGLGREAIANLEQGKRRVFADQLIMVADALHVPVTALLALGIVDQEPLQRGARCLLMCAPHHVMPITFGLVTRVTGAGEYYVQRHGESRSRLYSPELVKRVP